MHLGRFILDRTVALSLGLVAALSLTPASDAEEAQRTLRLATATPGGTYHPVGLAIANLVNSVDQPSPAFRLAAVASAGSAENVARLRDGSAELAIIQSLFGHYARNGTGPFKTFGPQTNIRAIMMLWQDVEQFVLLSKLAPTGTLSDLASLRNVPLALGERGSGTLESNRLLLGNLHRNIETDYELFDGGYDAAASALREGKVVGLSFPSGPPTPALVKLFQEMGTGLKLLSITPELAVQATAGTALWTNYRIRAGTYPGQTADVTTIAQPNFLAVSSDVSEDDVYALTKAIYANLDTLRQAHPAIADLDPSSGLVGLPVPLHVGAIRYFREIGSRIPERLLSVP